MHAHRPIVTLTVLSLLLVGCHRATSGQASGPDLGQPGTSPREVSDAAPAATSPADAELMSSQPTDGGLPSDADVLSSDAPDGMSLQEWYETEIPAEDPGVIEEGYGGLPPGYEDLPDGIYDLPDSDASPLQAAAPPPGVDPPPCGWSRRRFRTVLVSKSNEHHIGGNDHMARLSGNLRDSFVEHCDFNDCGEGVNQHGTTHVISWIGWCEANPYYDPEADPDNPEKFGPKCLPKASKVWVGDTDQSMWVRRQFGSGVHKHRWDLSRSTCAFTEADVKKVGVKACNLTPNWDFKLAPANSVSFRSNGVPVELTTELFVGMGAGYAAQHGMEGSEPSFGIFLTAGPLGITGSISSVPPSTYVKSQIRSIKVACGDDGTMYTIGTPQESSPSSGEN